ncbi:MAG: hypothetical protein ACLGI3_21345, partial [Actinomycetes bacterium]
YLEPHLGLGLVDVPRSKVTVDYDELRSDRPLGIVTRLENKAADLERTLHTISDAAVRVAAEADRARAEYGQPYPHRQALDDARVRSAQLAAELAEQKQPVVDQPGDQSAGQPTAVPAAGAGPTSLASPPAPVRRQATLGSTPKPVPGQAPVGGRPVTDHRASPAVSDARGDRWAELVTALHPRVTDDPHWPALAAQLEHLDAAGIDVQALLQQVIAERPLPAERPARNLDYRLATACPASMTRPQPGSEAPPAVAPPAPSARPRTDGYRHAPRR